MCKHVCHPVRHFQPPHWFWGGYSSSMCYEMPLTPFTDLGPNAIWNLPSLLRTVLLLATVLHLYRADNEFEVYYQQQRHYYRIHGHLLWEIDISVNIRFTTITFTNSIPSNSLTCLPIGDYHNATVGHAVCNTDPSDAYMKHLVWDTVANNITSLSIGHYRLSGIDGRRPGFQCMRFSFRILEHERNVYVFNLSATPCPGLSLASLLYPHPYLNPYRAGTELTRFN